MRLSFWPNDDKNLPVANKATEAIPGLSDVATDDLTPVAVDCQQCLS